MESIDKLESIDSQKRRVANALYEAVRYKKRYRKTEHLVEFDLYKRRYGVLYLREKYDNGRKYDVVRIYETNTDGSRTWAADLNVDGMTFEEITQAVYSASLNF